jgi:hypothetical protein
MELLVSLGNSMPPAKREELYAKLLQMYRDGGHKDPKLALNYDIEKLRGEGLDRKKAIITLYEEKLKQVLFSEEAKIIAERRIGELESELNELRVSLRNRAEEVESIKKYLAYTHRLTTSQTLARVCFYVIGAALVILSIFQYNTLTIYVSAASGSEWIFVLDSFITLCLGVVTIALGWVLESMARVNPVF